MGTNLGSKCNIMQTLAVGDMKYMAFISGTGSLLLNRSSTTEEIKGLFNQRSYRHRQTHLSWLGLLTILCMIENKAYLLFSLTSDPTFCSMMRGAWW